MNLIDELRRRNVLRVAAGYALIAWILIEAGSVLLPEFFGAPDYVFKVYVLIVFAGFLVSLVFAWVFEITPEGVKRERDLDRTALPTTNRRGGNRLLIGLLAIALGVSLTFNISGIRSAGAPAPVTVAEDLSSVAVLPFVNTSADAENQAFADGLHGDLLSRLSGIDALHVISRTSVNEYRDTSKNLRQIAGELGVSTIVEGSVQRAGNQVRVNVSLREGTSERPLWSERFDRELTAENLFAIQSEITNHIAAALRTALSPEDASRSARVPTNSIEAFTLYAEGARGVAERQFESLERARRQFEAAIEIDPQFAHAHAGLAKAVLLMYVNYQGVLRSEAYEVAEAASRRALEIDPELAEAHAVRGLLFLEQWQERRVGNTIDEAAQSLETALALDASHTDAYVWLASLRQEQGNLESSVRLLTTALTRDPLSRIPYLNLAYFLALRGRHDDSLELLIRAARQFPDWSQPYNYLSQSLQRLGRLDEAIAWDRLGAATTNDPLYGGQLIGTYQALGEPELVTRYLESLPAEHPFAPLGAAFVDVLGGDVERGVAALSEFQASGEAPPMVAKFLARHAIMVGEFARARDIILDDVPTLALDRDDLVDRFNVKDAVVFAFVLQQLGEAGKARDILTSARTVVEDRPRLGFAGHGILDVEILALLGQQQFALNALEAAVNEGFVGLQLFDFWSIEENPLLDTLRDDPRYAAIVADIEERQRILRESVKTAEANDDWGPLLAKLAPDRAI